MKTAFELFLFFNPRVSIDAAAASGVDALVVDWECKGKDARQKNYDTEINFHTFDDLVIARQKFPRSIVCRIDGPNHNGRREVERAIEGGATEILVPMVRRAEEVERILAYAAGRCGVGILVETREAVAIAADLASLPLTRVYVGLNDLSIERGTPNLFAPLIDGTIEELRRHFDVPFGFGGLTDPERGAPVPCRLLIGEMVRLGCHFSFLRRSFYRDAPHSDLGGVAMRIRDAFAAAGARTARECLRDREDLVAVLEVCCR